MENSTGWKSAGYEQLMKDTSLILHNCVLADNWTMNNLKSAIYMWKVSFREYLRGVDHIVDRILTHPVDRPCRVHSCPRYYPYPKISPLGRAIYIYCLSTRIRFILRWYES